VTPYPFLLYVLNMQSMKVDTQPRPSLLSILKELLACRLIPSDRDPETDELKIRPIGIGEVLLRIIGKCVTILLKIDITQVAGSLQTCADQQVGTEASIHAMSQIYEQTYCEESNLSRVLLLP